MVHHKACTRSKLSFHIAKGGTTVYQLRVIELTCVVLEPTGSTLQTHQSPTSHGTSTRWSSLMTVSSEIRTTHHPSTGAQSPKGQLCMANHVQARLVQTNLRQGVSETIITFLFLWSFDSSIRQHRIAPMLLCERTSSPFYISENRRQWMGRTSGRCSRRDFCSILRSVFLQIKW